MIDRQPIDYGTPEVPNCEECEKPKKDHTQEMLDLCSRIDPEVDATLHTLHDSRHSPTNSGYRIAQYETEFAKEPEISIEMNSFLFSLSTTYVYHAEAIAIIDCILHRYYPRRLFVSSQSKEEKTFLCGDCRQQLLEINADCEVIVLNPDGTRKNKTMITVSELLPRHKNVREKNKYYRALCGYSK